MSGKKLYQPTAEGGITFKSERRAWEVRVPAWVYDLWMPLVGAEAIGVYSLYCRLEMNEGVRKITMRDIARAARIGDKRLGAINATLQDCGFITVNKPDGAKRLMHWTTEIIVHDPPQDIAAATIKKYQHPQGYTPVSKWLVGPAPETLGSVSDDTDQCDRTPPCSVSNIGTLGLVGSLDTTTPTPPTTDNRQPAAPSAASAGGGGRDKSGIRNQESKKPQTATYSFLRSIGMSVPKATAYADMPLEWVRARWDYISSNGGAVGGLVLDLAETPVGTATPAPAPARPAKPVPPPKPYEIPGYHSLTYDQQREADEAWRAEDARYQKAMEAWKGQSRGGAR
jgi:hypothetical protein